MRIEPEELIDLLSNKKNGNGLFARGSVWCRYDISDYTKPIVITFASYKPRFPSVSKIESSSIWGYDFIKKEGLNVISFSVLGNSGSSWYRCEEFAKYTVKLGQPLKNHHTVYGYGGSMGAFGVAAYSNVLHMDHILLINPFSTLDKRLVPFEKRFKEYAVNLDWDGKFNDGAETRSSGYVIYDPIFHLDALQAKRFPNLIHLHIPGVGHSIPMHMKKLGLLGFVAKSFLHKGTIDKDTFYEIARNRRKYVHYYDFMCSKMNIHLTPKRKMIIRRTKFMFLRKEFLNTYKGQERRKILKILNENWKDIMQISNQSTNISIFKRKVLQYLKEYKASQTN